jgi:galactose mutarotase-like enzyme
MEGDVVRARAEPTRVQGFPAITLLNDALSCTIVPDLGGKISSIRDLRTRREWLWSNPSLSYRQLPQGTSYVQAADTGGWDECFPTVAACAYPAEPWKGAPIADHGDIWAQSWPVEVVPRPDGAITVRAEGPGAGVLPYHWRRAITLSACAAKMHIAYRVTNTSDAPIAYIWSAHPLFAVEPGMRIQIPAQTRMHRWSAIPSDLLPDEQHGRGYGWPVRSSYRGQEVDLSIVPDATAGIAVKLWSAPLSTGEVALLSSDGMFRLTFDSTLVPRVGLWLNAGGWSGAGDMPYYNLALEPCIGAQDSLEEAVNRYRAYGIVPAGGSREWWVDVDLRTDRLELP